MFINVVCRPENYDYLKRFLVGLRDTEDETSIKDWKTEGAVYMDYINMMQTLNQLKEVCYECHVKP